MIWDAIDKSPDDVLGVGWRIHNPAARQSPLRDGPRSLPAPECCDRVLAQVIDAEIGLRTLKPHDDKPIRFRYLLRVLVSFSYNGESYHAVPISWHHEFDSRDSGERYCSDVLGYEMLSKENFADAVGRAGERSSSQTFWLNVDSESPTTCWLSPTMPNGRLQPDFDVVISLGEDELAHHRRQEKRTTPLLWAVKIVVLMTLFAVLLWRYH